VVPSILIVDDDAGMVDTLADIFAAKRYAVATAPSGDAAVGMVDHAAYDVVLMDIQMPGLDGVDALKAIKARAPRTPVVMMTASTRHERVEEARRAAAVAVLPKPLDVDRVLALVEEVTRQSSASRAAE
jgi:DNA-binding NtrC family response regulator